MGLICSRVSFSSVVFSVAILKFITGTLHTCGSYNFPFVVMQVRGAMEKYPPYQSIFAKLSYGESQMLDKAFYEEEVKRLCLSFEQQVYFLTPSFQIPCLLDNHFSCYTYSKHEN